MVKEAIIKDLEGIANAMRKNRMRVAGKIFEDPEKFGPLIEIVFDVDNKLSIKAAWVLELVCLENLDYLLPHLDFFTSQLGSVKFDSAIRPVSKICMLLAQAYHGKKPSLVQDTLSQEHIDRCIEAGFDWLITQQKVAVKAYTMEALYLFGKERDWVHPELDIIIRENMAYESCGYIARGKKILGLINPD